MIYESRNKKTSHLKPQTLILNQKPETRNLKQKIQSQIPNPKPQIRNLKFPIPIKRFNNSTN
jgi:hypothetical protein